MKKFIVNLFQALTMGLTLMAVVKCADVVQGVTGHLSKKKVNGDAETVNEARRDMDAISREIMSESK